MAPWAADWPRVPCPGSKTGPVLTAALGLQGRAGRPSSPFRSVLLSCPPRSPSCPPNPRSPFPHHLPASVSASPPSLSSLPWASSSPSEPSAFATPPQARERQATPSSRSSPSEPAAMCAFLRFFIPKPTASGSCPRSFSEASPHGPEMHPQPRSALERVSALPRRRAGPVSGLHGS